MMVIPLDPRGLCLEVVWTRAVEC